MPMPTTPTYITEVLLRFKKPGAFHSAWFKNKLTCVKGTFVEPLKVNCS